MVMVMGLVVGFAAVVGHVGCTNLVKWKTPSLGTLMQALPGLVTW